MLMEQTLHTLKALRLPGMATAFEEQQHQAAMAELSRGHPLRQRSQTR